MSEFLVEIYSSRASVAAHVEDVSRAAEQTAAAGEDVRFIRAIFVPEEETCFCLYQSPSADAVREVVTRAGLRFARISEAVSRTPHQEAVQ